MKTSFLFSRKSYEPDTKIILVIPKVNHIATKGNNHTNISYIYILRHFHFSEFHSHPKHINSLRPRQNGPHFADDIFHWIFLNKNIWIPIKISLKFVPKVPINNIPALVQKMAWRRPGDKPLSLPMMVCLLTHICVTRPQWVNRIRILIWTWKPIWCYSLIDKKKHWLDL